MDHLAAVGVGEGVGDLARDLDRRVDRERSLPGQPAPERLALDIGHDVVEDPVGFPGVEDWKDVRMVEAGGDLDLALEAVGSQRGGQRRPVDLERHPTVVLEVPGQVDGTHPAPAQLPLDQIAVPKRIGQSEARYVRHGRPWGETTPNVPYQ